MEKKDRIKEIFKNNNIEELDKYNKNTIGNIILEILEEEINDFTYESDINHLENILLVLPKYIHNKIIFHDKLEEIHQKIKTYLVQKPGNIEKSNHNYKLLKNIINNIELIQMSILYDYNYQYEESKYQLIDYILFDLKDITIFKDALKRFPYLVNYFDENNKKIIVSVIEKYIDEVINYNKEKGIDNIIYYDEIINSILKSDKFIFDIIDKQTLLKKIKKSLKEIKKDKNRKTFYLNNLIEKINDKEEEKTEEFLEYKYNIPTIFNVPIKSEVRSIISSYTLSKDRKIIDDYILTFDSIDAEEIDDALSVKVLDNGNILLGGHIADPLALIDKNNIIFDEASKRTTSIYLDDKTHSMFPKELSCNLMSLKEGNYRNAISYYFEFDKQGNLINSEFIKSIIKVNKNMTYKDFNRILSMNGSDKLKESIANLSMISNVLQKYYHPDPLYEKINRSHKNITNTNIIGMSCGEKVVENTMIFINHMVAEYFKNNNLPFMYRNHTIDQDMMKTLDKIKYNILEQNGNNDYLKYIEMIKNIYPKAQYNVECKGHFGLGIDSYSHITSPLRRFADIIASICLEELYFNKYNKKDVDKVKSLVVKHSKNINHKRNSLEKYVNDYENLTR